MARKTIKGLEVIITDLEKRLNEQNKINIELHNKISQMQMIADDKFENSPMYHQMNGEIEQLKAVIRLNEINTKSKDDTIKGDRAVSYTHLDVYKRQGIEIPYKNC